MEKFITVKVVESHRYRVEFQRCYKQEPLIEENRDHENNRIVIISKTNPNTIPQVAVVSDDLGNHYCTRLEPWEDDEDGAWDHIFDSLFLDSSAIRGDFDFYSDLYKDIYGFRPHYSKEQWERVISRARSLNYLN